MDLRKTITTKEGASVYSITQHFIENDIKEIENLIAAALKGKKEFHNLSQDVHDRILGLGGRLFHKKANYFLSVSAWF
ncbi:hypothetical protein [Enterocloster citroniae]|uniref:hypothetical protein n=1 Tax=Enterocloster citroniae TaxID=358743 RepID=UPI001899E6F4|nr:hypothetical protein [Enterocloster citroniae]